MVFLWKIEERVELCQADAFFLKSWEAELGMPMKTRLQGYGTGER